MRRVPRVVAVAIALLSASTPVRAQDDHAHTESIALAGGADWRSLAQDWLILPEGSQTLAGNLRFITAEGGLGEGPLRFTDVLLVDVNGRMAVGGRSEVFGGLTLLPKQPSRTGEVIWQGAQLGGRVGLGERYAASLRAQVGPTLAHSGNWLMAELALEGRKSLHETLVLQGLVGASATGLRLDDGARRLGFGEVVADGTLIFREPRGMVAMWLGTQLRFPVGRFASPGSAREALDPQTRVQFRLGGVLSYIDEWDIFAEFSVSDRGELSNPSTTLPILDGGFDQTTLTLGLTRRFHREDVRRRSR